MRGWAKVPCGAARPVVSRPAAPAWPGTASRRHPRLISLSSSLSPSLSSASMASASSSATSFLDNYLDVLKPLPTEFYRNLALMQKLDVLGERTFLICLTSPSPPKHGICFEICPHPLHAHTQYRKSHKRFEMCPSIPPYRKSCAFSDVQPLIDLFSFAETRQRMTELGEEILAPLRRAPDAQPNAETLLELRRIQRAAHSLQVEKVALNQENEIMVRTGMRPSGAKFHPAVP
jgi:hypothetical protein